MNTKGQSGFGLLRVAAIAFVVVTVLLAIGADITNDVKSNQCTTQNYCGVNGTSDLTYNEGNDTCTCINPDGDAAYANAGDTAWNASVSGLNGIGDLSGNLTTIATVVGAVILLGFLGVRLFGGRQ